MATGVALGTASVVADGVDRSVAGNVELGETVASAVSAGVSVS